MPDWVILAGVLGVACLVPPAFSWLSRFFYFLIEDEDEWDEDEADRHEIGGLAIGIFLVILFLTYIA